MSSLRGPATVRSKAFWLDASLASATSSAAFAFSRSCWLTIELAAIIAGFGLRRFDIRPGFGNLFWTAAVAQSFDRLTLPRGGCLGFGELGLQSPGIQALPDLATSYVVSFLHQNRGDSLAVIEGQLDLPKIDVSVEH